MARAAPCCCPSPWNDIVEDACPGNDSGLCPSVCSCIFYKTPGILWLLRKGNPLMLKGGKDMGKKIVLLLMAMFLIISVAEGETMTINASMGELYGVLTLPEGNGPVPLVILSHGFGGDHTGQQDYSDYFVSQGLATFNFDFCGGGRGSKSAGTMLDMTVLTEAADLNAVIDHFKDDPRFSCIMLWGGSQGGFVSAYVSAQRPSDVATVVLEFPAIVLQDDAKARANEDGTFPETSNVMGNTISHKYNEAAVSFDLYAHIKAYKGPVLILHGDADRIVPLRYSQKAAEVYENASLIVYPGQGHGFIGQSRDDAKAAEASFLKENAR